MKVLNLTPRILEPARLSWYSVRLENRGSIHADTQIFFLPTCPDGLLRPSQPPTWWVRVGLLADVRRLGPYHSRVSSVEIKKAWSYTSAPPIHLHVVVLN
jgi:hypothetical protein